MPRDKNGRDEKGNAFSLESRKLLQQVGFKQRMRNEFMLKGKKHKLYIEHFLPDAGPTYMITLETIPFKPFKKQTKHYKFENKAIRVAIKFAKKVNSIK
jgi:hypothetical protein